MKKLLLVLSLFLLNSLEAFKVQPMINGQPDGEVIELTSEQVQAFELLSGIEETIVFPKFGISSKDICPIECAREPFINLLWLVEGSQKELIELENYSPKQILEIIRVADYLGLRHSVKSILLHHIIKIMKHISWDDFCHYFNNLRNFFNDSVCNDTLKNELNDYFNPVLGCGSFDDPYNSACWSPDGSKLVIGRFHQLKIFDVNNGSFVYATHSLRVGEPAWSQDSRRIALGCNGKRVFVWSCQSKKKLSHSHDDSQDDMILNCPLVWSPDDTKIAVGIFDENYVIDIWDSKKRTERRAQLLGHEAQILSLGWSPDSKKLASASFDKTLRIWNSDTGTCEKILPFLQVVNSVSWSPDGTKIAVGSDQEISIWDVTTYQCEKLLKGHTETVNSVSWSPDGTQIASGASDKTIRIWNVENGECSKIFTSSAQRGLLKSVNWSPDGTMLVSIAFGEEAQLWYVGPVTMGELLLILKAKSMEGKSTFQQDEFLKEIWDSFPAYIRYKLQTQKPPMKKRKIH